MSLSHRLASFTSATALLAGGILTGGTFWPTPALAAAPRAFTAEATAAGAVSGSTVPVRMIFRDGSLRLEMRAPSSQQTPEMGASVFLAQKGQPYVYMLSPAEKMAFKVKQSMVTQQLGLPLTQLLSPGSWQGLLLHGGKRLGTAVVAGQRCTLWEKALKATTYKVWLSNRYQVPFRIQSIARKGHPAFSFSIQHFVPSEALPASSFRIPAGYQTTMLDLTQR